MSKKLVIFDLDGTLMDTSIDLMNAMNGMLDKFGYPNITVEQTKAYIGNGARNFVLRSLPEGKKEVIDEALKVYNEIYNGGGSPFTKLYDGMDKVLNMVKEEDCFIAIASNKPQPSTDEVYETYLKQYEFDYVYGNRSGFMHKPEKECGEYILNALGVEVNDAIIVGDGETDVEFAKNLGCKCVAVTWGYRSREILKQSGAVIFAESPNELYYILKDFLMRN